MVRFGQDLNCVRGRKGLTDGLRRCYVPEMLASTHQKISKNFCKSKLKVSFGWDKCKRVKVKYKTMAVAGGPGEQARGERGARAALRIPFALLANAESGKQTIIMVF